MKKIKIIGGRYGYISPSGVYSVKTSESEPFKVEDSEAERLIRRGVAEIVDAGAVVLAKGAAADEKPDSGVTPAGYMTDIKPERGVPEYDEDTTNAELQSIAKEYGIEIPSRATKSQIIEALDEYFGRADDNGTEDENIPQLNVKEPE